MAHFAEDTVFVVYWNRFGYSPGGSWCAFAIEYEAPEGLADTIADYMECRPYYSEHEEAAPKLLDVPCDGGETPTEAIQRLWETGGVTIRNHRPRMTAVIL